MKRQLNTWIAGGKMSKKTYKFVVTIDNGFGTWKYTYLSAGYASINDINLAIQITGVELAKKEFIPTNPEVTNDNE